MTSALALLRGAEIDRNGDIPGPTRRSERRLYWVWLGQIASTLCSAATVFSMSYTLFVATDSITLMVLFQVVVWGPVYWLGIIAGVVVDRVGARSVLITGNTAGAMIAIGMACAASFHAVTVPLLVSGALLQSVAAAGVQVSLQALAPGMVPAADLQRVCGRFAAAGASSQALAPPLAATLLTATSLTSVLCLDAASFVAALVAVGAARLPWSTPCMRHHSFHADISTGWQWIREHPPFAWLCAFSAIGTGINGMSGGLVAAYVLMRSGNDASTLAIVNVALAIGLVTGGLSSSFIARRIPSLGVISLGSLGAAVGRIGLGLGTSAATWAMSQSIRGFGAVIAQSTGTRLFQEAAPPQLRGRILGTQFAINNGLLPVGLVVGGVIGSYAAKNGADALGRCFAVFGACELVTQILLLRVRRAARQGPSAISDILLSADRERSRA